MRLFLSLFFCGMAVNCVFAQIAGVVLRNSSTPASRVSNAFSGTLVQPSDSISVMLYHAPPGATNEDIFTPIPPAATVGAEPQATWGYYNGGGRIVPGYVGDAPVSIQVRAFETTYGSTYEQALAAGPLNGRRALVGKSAIAQVILGSATRPAPTTAVCGPINVDIAGGGGPWLSVNDIVAAEGSNGVALANFKITLPAAQAQTVTVDFTTVDGSAAAGSDYVATNGTVTFSPGETVKIVPVTLTADGPVEADEDFYLDLSNGLNAVVVRSRARCVITEVRVTNISVDVSLSFNTVANHNYMVERSSDLVNWQPVSGATNIAGTGGLVTVIDRGNGCATSVVYRARVLEQ